MTSNELDQQLRIITLRATTDTILADTQALMELGFGPWSAFSILEKCIRQRSRHAYEERLRAPAPPVRQQRKRFGRRRAT